MGACAGIWRRSAPARLAKNPENGWLKNMNKVFLGIILAVCVLGMLLVMLNDRLGRKPEQRPMPPVAETAITPTKTPEEIEAAARALEIADAARALAGPEEQAGRPDVEILPVPEPIAPPPALRPEPPRQARPEPMPATNPATPEAIPPAPKAPEAKPAPAVAPLKPAAPEQKPAEREQKPAAPKSDAQPAGKSGDTISRFVVYARDKGATVRIGGNGKLAYSYMTLENPDRIVVDLPGDWKFPATPGIPKNDFVSAMRVGKSGDKTRLVIDLKAKPRKVALVPFKSGDGVDVRVDK